MNNKIINSEQKMAIKMSDILAATVVSDPALSNSFCDEIKETILSKNGKEIAAYKDVLKKVLFLNRKVPGLCNYTLRNASRKILEVLTKDGYFTEEERNEISKKAKQGGGARGVAKSIEVQNMQILTDEEKLLLEEIYKNGDELYKRGSKRNIKKIMIFLRERTGIIRQSESAIKKYLQNLSPIKKTNIKRNDPEENLTIKKLFEQYYIEGEKLPIEQIQKELNNKHNNNRSKFSIECYIRNHIKTIDQKKEKDEIRSDEEKAPLIGLIKDIKENRKKYSHQTGKQKGHYNRELIYESYKMHYPETTRSVRGLQHQIKRIIKKNWSEQ